MVTCIVVCRIVMGSDPGSECAGRAGWCIAHEWVRGIGRQ